MMTAVRWVGLFAWSILPGLAVAVDWAAAARREVETLGKSAWRPMLRYTVELHVRDTHPPAPPFEFPWEDTGAGYGYGPAFGHWDIIHATLDTLPVAPQHAREQLLNDVRLQHDDGFLPGLILMPGSPGFADRPFNPKDQAEGHPPLWVVAADAYVKQTGDAALRREFYDRARHQLAWFDAHRRAQPEGYYYNDIIKRRWESGIDQGVRFDEVDLGPKACVDATAHLYQVCALLAGWARQLGEDAAPWEKRTAELREFIRTKLWDEPGGFFHDRWAIEQPALRREAFEGFWPVVVGAATPEQAQRVINEWLLNPRRFFTAHPIATVGVEDPKFELRMWRGPSWNSMAYWAAVACVRYGRPDAARRLLEPALDDTAAQFGRTGKLWEYYHPLGGHPEDLARKPTTRRNYPWPDYLGHNPLLAMARLWDELQTAKSP